jgi:putative MATE family efflux protein
VALGIALAVILGLAGGALAPHLLALMGASVSTIQTGAGYTRVMLGGSITVVLLFVLNAVFRGAGDAAVAMRTLWLANGINIVLGPFLVFGWGPFPEMGVVGAAVATTIGRGVGVCYQVATLARTRGRLHVLRRHLQYATPAMAAVLRVARSGVAQVLVETASWVGLVRVLATFGSEVLAGYTIAIRIILFALLPSWGIANAAATLVGQNLGARQPERAAQAVWRAALYNVVFLGTVGVVLIVAAPRIVAAFTSEGVVFTHGVLCLRVVAAGFPFYAYGLVVARAFNGAGDTRTPTYINLICFWLLEIPLAYLLSTTMGFGPWGAYLAITIAFSSVAVLSVVLFRRGRWKAVGV